MLKPPNSVSPISDRIFIEIEIYGRTWPALIDTGATQSVVNDSIEKWLRELGIPLCERNSQLEMADGSRTNALKSAYLPVRAGSKLVVLLFDVLPCMPYSVVLGTDYLSRVGAKLDLSENTIRINNILIPALSTYQSYSILSGGTRALHANDHLKPDDDVSLMHFLDNELKLFDLVPGRTRVVRHRIVLENSTPIKQRYYPVSPVIQEMINSQLDEMLQKGVIEPSNSSWSSPVLLVPKKDGSKRFVVDFRKVNNVSKKDAYPIPFIASILDKLRAGKYVSTLDLEKGYWQVELEERSREITAFTIPGRGLFQFRVMPFGLHSAGATFQRLMDKIIGAELEPHTFAYLDDIVVVSSSLQEHLGHLREVFKRLRNAGLKINVDKCQFAKSRLKFLGYIVGNGELETDPEKISAVANYPRPSNVSELRRFLGFVGWYRRFVPRFASVAAPLTDLLKHKCTKFSWSEGQENAFITLKECLISAPILACPNFDLPFAIECDASGVGIGGVLTQNDEGQERVIAYCSRTLSPAERNYSTTERECLAVLFAINKFKPYIEGYRFIVITDHASLKWLANFSNPQGRLARWISQLQQFDCEIVHRKGSCHVVPDALSRIAVLRRDSPGRPPMDNDSWYMDIWQKAKKNQLESSNLRLESGKLYSRGSDGTWKCLVPASLRPKILEENHSSSRGGHLGFYKTLRKVKDFYSWPTLTKDVSDYVRRCHACQRYKVTQAKPAGFMSPHEMVRPWTIVASDIIGPLPRSLKGNRYILVFLDTSTRWPIAIPLRTVKTSHVANCLRNEVVNIWGCPEILLTDNGPQYVSRTLKKVCALFDIKLCHTAPYFPQANPCERTNRTLKTMLSIYCEGSQRRWDENLSDLMFALRTAVSETTGYSPAELNFGRRLRKPKELYRDCDSGETEEFSPGSYAGKLKEALVKMATEASVAQRKASTRQAHYYNLRRRHVELSKGTLVWRRNFPRSDAAQFTAAKLEPRFLGPFLVKDKVSTNIYSLITPGGKLSGDWHVRDLKPVH